MPEEKKKATKPRKPRTKKPKQSQKQKQAQSQVVNVHLGEKTAKPKRRRSPAKPKATEPSIPHIYAPQVAAQPVDYYRIGDIVASTAKSLIATPEPASSTKPVITKSDFIKIKEKASPVAPVVEESEEPVMAEAKAYYPQPKRVNVRKPLTEEQKERKRAADRARYIRKRDGSGTFKSVPSQDDLGNL